MSTSYQVTKFEQGGNYVSITITVNDDGGLQVFDYSTGSSKEELWT